MIYIIMYVYVCLWLLTTLIENENFVKAISRMNTQIGLKNG